MKMSEVKVGMQFKGTYRGCGNREVVTVTEITDKGFKYTHPAKLVKIGLHDGIPEFGTAVGGEHFGLDGEVMFDPV